MLILGGWRACDHGIIRPIFEGEILAADGLTWEPTRFLADVGADRTVFNGDFLNTLALPHIPAPQQLGGVGGSSSTVIVRTQIRFALDDGRHLLLQGAFAAFTDPCAMDMNILGRDVMNQFAVIVDRPAYLVCMLAAPHRYRIEETPLVRSPA